MFLRYRVELYSLEDEEWILKAKVAKDQQYFTPRFREQLVIQPILKKSLEM